MNKKRRARLQNAILYLNEANRIIEGACDEEQDCLDNMPENLEYSSRYEKMEETVTSLTEALDGLEGVIANVCDAME